MTRTIEKTLVNDRKGEFLSPEDVVRIIMAREKWFPNSNRYGGMVGPTQENKRATINLTPSP